MKMLAELTNEMKRQECYIKYQECLKQIKNDKELYDELNVYRKKNVELHLSKQSLKEEAYLEKEFHHFLMKESVREFLHWEQKTMEMIRKVHDEIDLNLHLDISFF